MNNIEELLKEMTIDEKISLLTGGNDLKTHKIEKYGIPEIRLSDGPHGVRIIPNLQKCNIDGGDVCYPTASAIGSTWNGVIVFGV